MAKLCKERIFVLFKETYMMYDTYVSETRCSQLVTIGIPTICCKARPSAYQLCSQKHFDDVSFGEYFVKIRAFF